MPKKFNIDKFNSLLIKNDQEIQALEISGKTVKLSNGLELRDTDANKCKRRIMNGDSIWLMNFDKLYSLDEGIREGAEKKCKSVTSAKGGIKCQEKHGSLIKENLNIGVPWNKGLTGIKGTPHTLESKSKISKANSGQNNGMYGRKMSDADKKVRSDYMKQLILSGKFTPNSNNRNTHWESTFNNMKYRSSWEALYHYHNPDDEYEKLRISYIFNDKEFIYIVDFVNYNTKQAIEVKPKELCNDPKTKAKLNALKKWCRENNFRFIIADKQYLLGLQKPNNMLLFDSKTRLKIEKLYETN